MPSDRNFIPPRPVETPGCDSAFIRFCQWLWDQNTRPLINTDTVQFQVTSRGIEAKAARRSVSPQLENPFTISQSTDWLTYKVSTGLVVLSGDPITPTQVDVDLPAITAGVEHYWFYMDIGTTTAEVKTSATTLSWGCNKIPLGWVDTLTNQSTTTAKIYQLQRDHIFSPGA